MQKQKHILIIGGGISGLYAAYMILKRDKNVHITICEKSNRLGGRIHTVKYDNAIMDTGAARFNKNHNILMRLLCELGLKDSLIQLKPKKVYRKDTTDTKFNVDMYLQQAIKKSKDISDEALCQVTFKMFLRSIYIPSLVDDIIYAFGYNTEFENMNAKDAISIIRHDFLEDIEYYTLAGGMNQLIDRLVGRIKASPNVKVMLNTYAIRHDGNTTYLRSSKVDKKDIIIHSDHTFLCITREGLMKINGLYESNTILRKSLETVCSTPLLRIFAKFPCDTDGGRVWFHDIKRTSTNNMLRYIIPLNYKEGLIMISYTDAYHAEVWNSLKGGKTLEENIMFHLRLLFPYKKISAPLWVRKYYWKEGAHYWKQNPIKYVNKYGVYPYTICGEVVSEGHHGWIEGALDSVERAFTI